MSSRYTELFDSLGTDDITKRERAERIMSSYSSGEVEFTEQTGGGSVAKVRGRIFSGKRGIALITAAAIFISAVIVFIPVWVSIRNSGGLLKAMSLLNDTYVDMDGVAAFGVWSAPDSDSESAHISDVSYIQTASNVAAKSACANKKVDSDYTGDWSEDEKYEWESFYDWDPTKANVLIAIDDDGNISEVVYERTNGLGQVRQDKIGNAAAVYVSNSFTYVMYVDDDEWEFWKDINFAQEMASSFIGFQCHHDRTQTVVIHNATGKVFALKDLIPQVSELAGATCYTMQAVTFKDDYLCIEPVYGNYIPQWYNVIYDKQSEKIRYELMLSADLDEADSFSLMKNVCAFRRDKYGQQYLLESIGYKDPFLPRVPAGIVNLPSYTRYGNSLIFGRTNGMLFGTDGRMYVFDEGKLKVFGENFDLHPVEKDTEVAFEGVAPVFTGRVSNVNDGIAYRLGSGYLYSMFGEVWKVDDDGTLHAEAPLEGSFPRFADEGYLLGGEIIAFVDTQLTPNGLGSMSGRVVRIRFDSEDDTPKAVTTHIISASEISVGDQRMVIRQCENPYTAERGDTKYFLLTVQGGTPNVEYFADGYNGGITGLTRPITEPLVFS